MILYHMLYEKYKPKSFDEVIGQTAAVQILQNIAKHYETHVVHGIILSGQYGCGKTLCAFLFAHLLNGISVSDTPSEDILVIDAALYSSVDNMRQLIETIQYAPMYLKYRVVILEEAHMLSKEAMDVLLITLHTPPRNTVFVFTTTNLTKITKTLESRCLTVHISSLETEQIVPLLEKICHTEQIKLSPEVLYEIARASNGSLRQAISYLNTIQIGEINQEQIFDYLSIVSTETISRMLIMLLQGKPVEAYELWLRVKKNNSNKTILLHFEALFKEIILWKENKPNMIHNILKTDVIRDALTAPLVLQYITILHTCAEIDAAGYAHTVLMFFYMLAHVPASYVVPESIREIHLTESKIKLLLTNNNFAKL
jgi:DNA polymerase-3 subunit gamma/tau